MDYDFDLIVIGSGASGGTLAADIAKSGARVLMLERGPAVDSASPRDEQSTLFDKLPYDDRTINVNQHNARLYMGSGFGGGTSVYGGALLRPSRQDFHPGEHYSDRIPREIWDWPIDYSDLQPFYDEAERLYSVAVDGTDSFAPLESSTVDSSNPPLSLAPINERLVNRSRAIGLNPFRLPLGIKSSECLKCANCAGFVCPTGARRSSAQLADAVRQAGDSFTVLNNREILSLKRLGRLVDHASVLNRTTGEIERYRARRYVLAAGAIGSPVILERSGYQHSQLGRNYMMHYSPLVAGVFARSTNADTTFVKQIGFGDFYFGTPELPEKMGIVQSLPAPGPLMLKKSGLKYIPTTILNRLRRHLLPLIGIVEDLPQPNNRVTLSKVSPDGTHRISLQHHFSDFDRLRGDAMAKKIAQLLKHAGAIHWVSKQIPSAEHVAHQCGTIRFGDDPRHAIADRDCRMFELENVFVVDGSILPTSLGVGPSLTLIANALRVSSVLQKELTCTETVPTMVLDSSLLLDFRNGNCSH